MSRGSTRKLLSRRDVLKATVAAAGAAAVPVLGTRTAGAAAARPVARTRELHLVCWVNFVKEMDEVLIRQTEEWGKQNKVKVKVDRVGIVDLQSRIAAAIQAKAGPDIIELEWNWAWLYADSLADVTDVAEKVKKEHGNFYDTLEAQANVKGVYKAVPHAIMPMAFAYRTDYVKEAGVTIPKTWDELVAVAKVMKKFGKPVGQALGHSPADPPIFWYPWLWGHGGKEVEADGKTVAINSKESLTAIEKAVELFQSLKEGALSWDDSSNNRNFLAEEISITLNASSIYFVAVRDFPKIAQVTDHFSWPSGPAGRFGVHNNFSFSVTKFSKNQPAAKELITYLMAGKQLDEWLTAGKTFEVGPTPKFADHPAFDKDPKLLAMRDVLKNVKAMWWGWPGPPSAASAEAMVRYTIVDMFAKACSGEYKPAESVKWAESELKRVYKG